MSLENLVLIMFEYDTVLIPKETCWFGYYPDGAFSPILAPQQTKLYSEDWIGLKTLDEAGRVKFIEVAGNHLGISTDDMKKHVVPYLQDAASKVISVTHQSFDGPPEVALDASSLYERPSPVKSFSEEFTDGEKDHY